MVERSSGVKRLFLAVPLPMAEAAVLHQHLPALPGKPVPPQNWHLTVRFLGQVGQVTEERLCAELDQSDLGTAFELGLGALGAFPRPARASVLWIGIDRGSERLAELNEISESLAQLVGITPEDRPYSPHLTLSRIRPEEDVRNLLETYEAMPLRWKAEELVLFESRLNRKGADYLRVESFRFRPIRAR